MNILEVTAITYDYAKTPAPLIKKTLFLNLDHVLSFERADYEGGAVVFFETPSRLGGPLITAKLYKPDYMFLNGNGTLNPAAFLPPEVPVCAENTPAFLTR